MDKSTLSNYGWIIVTTIIIALMIVLATPFGNYMKDSFTGITEQFTEAANVESGSSYDHSAAELHPSGIIPEGGTYIVDRQYYFEAGSSMPSSPKNEDQYIYGNYCYVLIESGDKTYKAATLEEARIAAKKQFELETGMTFEELLQAAGMTEDEAWATTGLTDDSFVPYSIGWRVHINTAFGGPDNITDKKQVSYGKILESINGVPVKYMNETFSECTSLTVAPVIPKGVTDISSAFYGCTSLTGSVEISANNIDNYASCFAGTTKPITLSGSCPILADIAATASGNVTVQ